MISPFLRGKTPVPRALIPTRVLVVDDEPLIRWSICTALTAEGFDAVPAADAVSAEGVAGEWPPPKVAIIDSRVRGVNGDDLVAHIQRVYPDCQFLLMTTAQRGSGFSRLSTGVLEIEKPFDLARVVSLVNELARVPQGEARS